MSDSDVYLPSTSPTESFDTSYSSGKEMEVASTIQPYEGEQYKRRFLRTLTKTVSCVQCSGQD